MTVRVGDSYSEWKNVYSGVPQGSVLGPLLFVLFINDMPENIKSVIRLFADDVKLVGDANDSDVVMQDLESLSNWESDWCMNFNPKKCAVDHIGKNSGRQSYFLGGNEPKVVDEEKDLGVVFSESFSWFNHIQESIGKAKRMTSWILRNVLSREVDVLLPVYKSMMRPHLEYCVQGWAPRPGMVIGKVQWNLKTASVNLQS